MLSEIRGIADSFLIRALLWLVALSFIIWGVQQASKGMSSKDIVKFSHAKNITTDEFLEEKTNIVKRQEQTLGHSLTEEEVKTMNLDAITMQKIIRENIVDYMASYYNLNISDEFVIQSIKDSKLFKNENVDFDVNLFNSAFKSNYQKEMYLESMKKDILKHAILSIFLESFYVPNVLKNNINNYIHEGRKLDIISLDLTSNNKEFQPPSAKPSDLEELYKSHIDSFTLPEKRSFSYVAIPQSILLNNIEINTEEINTYYNDNKEKFENKLLSELKGEIKQSLKEEKLESAIIELMKKLEEEVAEGLTLKEICDKHAFSMRAIENKSLEDIKQDNEIKEAADILYEMTEQEVSYPIEDRETKEIMLFQLSKIFPSNIESFESVKERVNKLWLENALIAHNIKVFSKFAIEYKSANDPKNPIEFEYKIDSNTELLRDTAFANNILPPELIKNIFETKINENTQVVRVGNMLYFANIKSVFVNKNIDDKLNSEVDENITNNVKNIAVQELINYFIKENNVKIKYKEPNIIIN